jgi:hypothetical protein
MQRAIFYLLILPFLFLACSKNEPPDKQIIGKWKMVKVYEYNNDVTSKHNPNNNRWIKFTADGNFVSDGDPFGKNTGRWKVDNEKSILYIDSDIDDDDSEWSLKFKNDEMIWTGIGHPRKENTKLIHKRIED